MIEKIKDGEELLAIVVKDFSYKEGVEFVTPDQFSIQLGLQNRSKGTKVPAHAHFSINEIKNVKFSETFYIKKGKVNVTLYNLSHQKIKDIILNTGDIIYLIGGHSVEFLEDSQIIEFKQGPYQGVVEDKKILE